MKTRVILTLCIALMLGLVSNVHAQLVAGSPEDKAFQKIDAETNGDAKEALLLDFEKQFPQSNVMPEVYSMLMGAYQQKNNTAKVNEYGEKIIKVDANNVSARIAVARNYALAKQNLELAIDYAQKAIDILSKMKAGPMPANFTKEQWDAYVAGNEQAAQGLLAYAKSLKK